jgi:uncharacterized protein (TIGR02246 family)
MQNDEQEIREFVANWLSASEAGDIEKVLSLMSDDVVFLGCGQPPMRGKSAFAESQATFLSKIDLETTSEIQEIKVLGDWAYMWTHLSIVITPKDGGAAVRRAGNTMSILQKQNGSWVIVRDANMLAVAS